MARPEGSVEAQGRAAVAGMFGRDSAYTALWAVQLGAAALFTPVTTRVLGVDRFGQVATATAVMQILFAISGLSLQSAVQRHFAEDDGPAKARKLLALAMLSAFAFWALADLTGRWWAPAVGAQSYSGAVRLAVAWAGLAATTNVALALLRSHDRLLGFALTSLMQSVVAEGVSLALVYGVQHTAAMFVLGQTLSQVAALAVALVVAPPALLRRADVPLVGVALRYSVGLVPAALAGYVMNAADRLIVSSKLDPASVARYQVAYNIGSMPLLLLGVLNTVWMPRVFAISERSLRESVLAQSRDAVNRILASVLLGLALGAPIMLRIWVPASYRPDTLLPIVVVVAVSTVPYAAGLASQRVLLTAQGTWWIALCSILAAVLNVALNFALIPLFAILGAAAATLLSYGALFALLQLRARQILDVPRASTSTALVLLASVVAAALSLLLPTSGGWLVLRGLATLATITWFVLTLRGITRSEPSGTDSMVESAGAADAAAPVAVDRGR